MMKAVQQCRSWILVAGVLAGAVRLAEAQSVDPRTITKIEVVGQPVKIFDHTEKIEALHLSDGPVSAWREAGGTVNLLMPCYEAYRLRGPDLLHLSPDRKKIYSATQSGGFVREDLYNCLNWIMGPYSEDGRTFYSLAHQEWYACLLADAYEKWPGWEKLKGGTNSWVTTVNSMVSTDGGASWRLNEVNGNHVVAKTGFTWTGSAALANKIYLRADNKTGLQQITRIIKEGKHYYAMGNLVHRDFSKIDVAAGAYQAPIDQEGVVLIRTDDFSNPNGWQAWTGDAVWEPIEKGNFKTFYPQRGGAAIPTWSPTLIYDTNAQAYIFFFYPSKPLSDGSQPLAYMTTKKLSKPSWSDCADLAGMEKLQAVGGFWAYATLLDPTCTGFSFDSTSSGSPCLFWNYDGPLVNGHHLIANRSDLYRAQLKISY